MNQRGCVEQDRDGQELPEQDVVVDADGERIERDIAQRVVEKMADQVGIEHQPAGKADLADADAADEFDEAGPAAFGHAFFISRYRPRQGGV
jgi:hypothetical protein